MNTRLSKYWLHSLSTNDNYRTWDESLREIDYNIGSIDHSKSPLDAPKINNASAKDSTIRTVIHQIAAGTAPVDQTDDILALLKHRSDLSINDDSLFFRGRTVIPKSLQPAVLRLLHSTHYTEQSVFWLGMTKDIAKILPGQKTDCSALSVLLVTASCALCKVIRRLVEKTLG